ncbi:hypothetical protein OEB99_10960 [Actinotalea sp. M2MS4P-6]|uniref:hypothetical protein n=1 Tax=Actinotalea sp. M2MS4P-6 TaxID=2983762 RepID=UPI0021E44712|nr:hypothetical protein [Actinotalea sp. M2MS4P-6]MCV2394829.1 hypothetical protein [Actinotalea sp. M2MS4P-6]
MTRTPEVDPTDREELLTRIAALEGEIAQLRSEPAPEAARGSRRLRAASAVAVVVIAALLAPLAVATSWARGLVTDTDRYLETVAPLADDPAIKAAITDQLATALLERIGPEDLAAQVTEAVAGLDKVPPRVATGLLALEAPLADAISSFVRQAIGRVVDSDQFSAAWVAANRAAHEQLVAVMQGDPDAIAQLDEGGNLSINLAAVLAVVVSDLSDRGFSLVDRLSNLSVSYPVMSNGDVVRLRQLYRLIDVLGPVLIWATLGLLAVGVSLAVNRARALMIAGFVLAGSAAALGLVVTIGRALYTDALVGQVSRLDAGLVLYDQVVGGLRPMLRTTLALGLVLVVVGFVLGGTSAARGLRSAFGRAGQAEGPAWLAAIRRSTTARWFAAHRGLVDGVVAVLAGVVLVAVDRLTPGLVVTVALVAGAVVLLARFFAPVLPGPEPVDQDADSSREVSSSSS